MTKAKFLSQLREKLQGLPQSDTEKFLDYYAEMIDDYMEDGCNEEQAIVELGSVEEIVAQILTETPLPRLVQEKVRPSRTLRAWEIVLLILGSPIWLPVALTIVLLFFTVFALFWSLSVLLYAVDAAAIVSGAAGILSLIPFALSGNVLQGVFLLGCGLILLGIGLLFLLLCNKVAVYFGRGSKWLMLRIKYAFIGKGGKK